jgi:FkbM family methyltransferase
MDTDEIARDSYLASMALLQSRGFRPATIIDIGAAEARFFLARLELGLFPDARHFLVDAMSENEEIYRRLQAKCGTGYEIVALSSAEGSANLRVDPDFYDTQLEGTQSADKYKERRSVPMSTLDSLVGRHGLPGPFAIKLDVQGAELDVLRGATRVLKDSLIVTTEIRLYNQRDTLTELLSFMNEAGWRAFDLTDFGHSLAGNLLVECYVTLIPARLDFREGLPWAAAEQMDAIREHLRQRRLDNLEALQQFIRSQT